MQLNKRLIHAKNKLILIVNLLEINHMILGKPTNGNELFLDNNDLEDVIVDNLNHEKEIVSLRIQGKKYDCKIIHYNETKKEYTLKVNGQIITLELSFPIQKTIQKIGLGNKQSQDINELKSPMPGLILEISVSVGESIKKDQPLIILEAMKMENVLTSPVDGKVAEIMVKPQQTVEKNNILITFEK